MVRQALSLKDKFVVQHSHDWLVWEPGTWKVPATGMKPSQTQPIPLPGEFDRPPRGDCLCFELNCGPSATIKVGRAPENEIVINDATVSREHLVLDRAPTGWTLSARRALQLSGRAIAEGTTAPLASGDRVVIGGVVLTFLSPAGFVERLKGVAQKQS